MAEVFLGVDVGTGSARAGIFDSAGQMLGTGKHPVETHHGPGGIVEQSSAQIWQAVCEASRAAVRAAGVEGGQVAGVGFDATCSLVILGPGGRALPASDPARPERNVIVWMDHRALDQAARINAGPHEVLRYVGGRISPEMETPKLLWLKENRAESYRDAAGFFDLTDFLTWTASGALERSACTVSCKWTYLAHEGRWDPDYFTQIGLGDLAAEGFSRIGTSVVAPGTALAGGLLPEAAAALGLHPGTPVAAGLIDAHAGGLATVGAAGGVADPTDCLAYVFGTSSCTMTSTRDPAFVPGVWGPYHAAMVPGLWLNEGGQSAAGAAIDQLLHLHPARAEAEGRARAEGLSLPDWLANAALAASVTPSAALRLADELQVLPEFLGNRAPFSDPEARAAILGLGMERDLASLIALYVAGLCGLGYGLRQIIETQAKHGAKVRAIAISGGAGAHPLARQILADATGLPVQVTESPEPVLLGAAMLAAVAAGAYPDLGAAMPGMSRVAGTCEPAAGQIRALHDARYRIFLDLQATARRARQAMRAALTDPAA